MKIKYKTDLCKRNCAIPPYLQDQTALLDFHQQHLFRYKS